MTVAERLRRGPFDAVEAVGVLVAEHVERPALRSGLPAYVLHDDGDALAGGATVSIAADGRGASFPYGVRSMITGNGPPSTGRYTLAW